jgi:rhamnose transport system ATP-binding protein
MSNGSHTEHPDDRDASGRGGALLSPALRISGITKKYGPSYALSDISFDILSGSVHALVGENGAGKSTLVKIITGIIQADSGQIFLGADPVHFSTSLAARAAGIGAVYQDPKLFPHLDIAENIFMGNYPTTSLGRVDTTKMYRAASSALRQLGVDIDPRSLIAGLSVAELQFVEIARAISIDLQLLILDEPTAALTPAESDRLFRIVRTLRDRGKSILLITHRLEEVEAIAEQITVLRDGRHIATRSANELPRDALIQLMVGRPIATLFSDRQTKAHAEEILRLESISRSGTFLDISFAVRAGEIVGMAGLVGAGRSEIAQSLFGITPPTSGRVLLNGRQITPHSPKQMLGLGLAYLPEDRDSLGLITSESIVNNIALPIIGKLSIAGLLNRKEERKIGSDAVKTYEIKASGTRQLVSALSGGNRQKVAFAKWLATEPKVLILDEPTHGVDIGSKAQIHRIITELADKGLAILVISSDLPEVLAISDRILVIAEGRLVAEFDRIEATQEKVMRAATTQGEAILR